MHSKPLRILRAFADRIRADFPNAQIWAFGSYVNGTASKDSDMDLCVALPEMSSDNRIAISDIAWEVGLANDILLSTIVVSQHDFDQGAVSYSPLLDTIRNEGVAA